MSVKLKKLMTIGAATYLIGVMGCAVNTEVKNSDYYLRCNKTSNGIMAEMEEGYFLVSEGILFYADKKNLEQWVPVCNKPNCMHNDYTCNGYLPSYNTIWQKDGKLYEITYGDVIENPYIFEIATDGSGLKKVYEIPIKDGVNSSGYGKATFQNEFLLRYGYLNESGIYQNHIIHLEDNKNSEVNIDTIHENIGERATFILSGNLYWSIRGDNLIVTTLFLEEGDVALNNLCRIDGKEIEPLNLPKDISFYGGYLSGDIFTYYQSQEGFYQYNISTGETELIFENQLEDGQGYILSDNCMVECNRYIDYMPEEAYLKVYNGKEWIDLELPEEITNCDNPFFPVCITSDSIFFRMNITGDDYSTTTYLYYTMLEEANPELVFAGKIGN